MGVGVSCIYWDSAVNGNHFPMTVVLCGWKATVTDVIATCVEQVADIIAIGDRWNSHMRVVYFILVSKVLRTMMNASCP